MNLIKFIFQINQTLIFLSKIFFKFQGYSSNKYRNKQSSLLKILKNSNFLNSLFNGLILNYLFIKIFLLKMSLKTYVLILMHFLDKMAHLFFLKMKALRSKGVKNF